LAEPQNDQQKGILANEGINVLASVSVESEATNAGALQVCEDPIIVF